MYGLQVYVIKAYPGQSRYHLHKQALALKTEKGAVTRGAVLVKTSGNTLESNTDLGATVLIS